MKIALIDDEKPLLQSITDILDSSLHDLGIDSFEIDTYSLPEQFFSCYSYGKYDIIILDIYMGEENGIEVARKIRNEDSDVSLVFCTSSNEFAAESYEVDAKYYLNKPVSKEKISAMLKRVNLSSNEKNRTITLPDGFRYPLRRIIYTEYSNHTVRFIIDGEEAHTVYMTHSEVEKLLSPHKGFHTINKGCMVNFGHMRKIETNAALLKSGEILPIARRRFKEIETAYKEYRFEQLNREVDR